MRSIVKSSNGRRDLTEHTVGYMAAQNESVASIGIICILTLKVLLPNFTNELSAMPLRHCAASSLQVAVPRLRSSPSGKQPI